MKLDRLIGILSILLQSGRSTAPELARRFEVSRRTINRDIEALCRAGIPVVTTQGANGGIAIMEGFDIDRGLMSGGELRAILAGLRSLDSVSGTSRYAQLMEKLSVGQSGVIEGDDRMLINLASWYGPSLSDKIETLRAAMDRGLRVTFQYHSPRGSAPRRVEPGYIVFQWSSWYLWGWCQTRQDWRLFKLNRMTELTLGEACPPRPVPMPDLSNGRVFPERWAVKALVHPDCRWRLIEEYGPDCYAPAADGRLLFQFGFTDREQVLSWILSFQGKAELVEPAELREDLRRIGEGMARIYGKGEGL